MSKKRDEGNHTRWSLNYNPIGDRRPLPDVPWYDPRYEAIQNIRALRRIEDQGLQRLRQELGSKRMDHNNHVGLSLNFNTIGPYPDLPDVPEGHPRYEATQHIRALRSMERRYTDDIRRQAGFGMWREPNEARNKPQEKPRHKGPCPKR